MVCGAMARGCDVQNAANSPMWEEPLLLRIVVFGVGALFWVGSMDHLVVES